MNMIPDFLLMTQMVLRMIRPVCIFQLGKGDNNEI